MIEKLTRCTLCNQVIPQFDSFGDFGATPIFPEVEWASEDLDEQKAFSQLHQNHHLEELWIDRGTLVSDKPVMEPVKVSFMEATNGKEKFLIKRTRASLARPVSYELILGK